MDHLSRFYRELKRRNVFRAGVAYLVVAWLAIQVADILLDAFSSPEWVMRSLIVASTLGFPVTLVLSWIYEITVEGVKRTEDVLPQESITNRAGRKLDFVLIGVLSVAVALFALDRFVWRQFELVDAELPNRYSMAVLPFEYSSNQIAPFFGELSSELTRTLLRGEQILLASSDAINAVPTDASVSQIAARTGVRFVVGGELEIVNQDLELNLSLFDAENDAVIGKETFGKAQLRETTNEVAEWLATRIGAKPLKLKIEATDRQAFALYLQARQHQTSEFLSDDAEQLYRQAIDRDPRLAPAYAGLCSLFVRQFYWSESVDDFEEAEKHCLRAWTIDEQLIETQLALGGLYEASGQTGRAREMYTKVLSLNANNYEAKVALAESFHEEDPGLAETSLRRIIEQNPGSPNAYMSLQYLFWKQGRFAEAVEQQRWAVRLLPNDEGALIRLSTDLMYAGEFDEASSLLIDLLEQGPVKTGEVENNLGFILFFEGDFAEAARLFRNAVAREPEDPLSLRNLGDALWHLSGEAAAEPIFLKAIGASERLLEINQNDYFILTQLMVAYASIGESDRFYSLKDRVLEYAPADPQNHYDIAVGASRLGDSDAARHHASRAKELGFALALLEADPDIRASGVSFE